MSKRGFTLAEVLITLGIIGVVAAITIPILISNIRDKQNIVRWRKVYSQLNQAFMQTLDDGYITCNPSGSCVDRLIWTRGGWNNEFVEQMVKKFKVSQICTSGECYYNRMVWAPDYYRRYKTLSGGTVASYNFSGYRIKLLSGELIMFGGSHGGPWLSVDVDGFEHGKNTLGKDVFIIKVYNEFLRPMGAKGTFGIEANGETCECSKDSGALTSTYIAGAGNATQEVVSGACCSAYYLKNDK